MRPLKESEVILNCWVIPIIDTSKISFPGLQWMRKPNFSNQNKIEVRTITSSLKSQSLFLDNCKNLWVYLQHPYIYIFRNVYSIPLVINPI